MRNEKSSECEKEEAGEMRRNGEKMKNVLCSIETVTGSNVKDFRKAKQDPYRQKLLADWGEKFYIPEGQNKIPGIAKT